MMNYSNFGERVTSQNEYPFLNDIKPLFYWFLDNHTWVILLAVITALIIIKVINALKPAATDGEHLMRKYIYFLRTIKNRRV